MVIVEDEVEDALQNFPGSITSILADVHGRHLNSHCLAAIAIKLCT